VDRPDPFTLQDDVARGTRPEEHWVIARQLDELNASLTVVDFQSSHAVFQGFFPWLLTVAPPSLRGDE
jgi:hypothetical protein